MENIEDKGRRYISEGRLSVKRVDYEKGVIVAEVKGSDALYHLGFDPAKKEWRCTCPARGRCAHLVALQLVVTKP